MRPVTSRAPLITALAAALVLAGWPATVAANESFTLTVPARPGLEPAARVLLTLELAGPAAGSSIAIGSGAPVPIPGAVFAGPNLIVAAIGPDGNSVILEYTLTSKFCTGSLCTFAGAPGCATPGPNADVELSAQVKFTGADITAYRINTYTVGAPAIWCGVAKKRVGTPAATVTPAAIDGFPALAATPKGRHPLDLIFVLDRSGSMSDPPPMGNPGDPSKWSILKSSLTTLITQWASLDASGHDSNDRIGMVFFASSASATGIAGGEGPSNFLKKRGTNPPGGSHDWQSVISAIPMSPGGSTALGPGVRLGLDNWEEISASSKTDAVVVVMTDGMQNVSPEILTDPDTFILTLAPAQASDPAELYKRAIPMRAIAFGTPAVTEHELLDRLAQQTSGVSYQALDSAGMNAGMADVLISALKGNTASLGRRTRGTIVGLTPSPLIPVIVDQSAERAVFTVQWAPPLADALDLQVFPPGMTPTPTGTGATAATRMDSPQSTVLTYNVTPATVGTWQIRVVRKQVIISDGEEDGAQPSDVPYTFSAHFAEKRLDFALALKGVHQGTGDTLEIRAEMGYDDLPLTGLPPNAIRVTIARPGESLGTILHEGNVTPAPDTSPGDTTPPHAQAANGLTDAQQQSLIPQPVSTISLTHQGNGVYTGSFSGTSEVGLYQFQVVLDWNDPRTGRVHREERLERDVKLNPSPSNTTVSTDPQSGGSYAVTVTPKDQFGNFMGPGHGNLIKVTVNGPGTVSGPTDPQNKGDYVFTITGVPAGQTPDVDVTVGGVQVSGGGSSGGAGGTGTFRLFFDLGLNVPHGTFNTAVDGGFSFNGGIEYFVAPMTSLEGIIGYHTFDAGALSDPHIWQFSVGAKQYFGPGPLRAFVNGGVGLYRFDPGSTTKAGFNVGGGVIFDVTPRVAIEGVYNLHRVNTSGASTRFSTIQGGVRIRIP